MKKISPCLVVALLMLAAGCQTAYYAVWEQMGKEKRHLLKENVEKAKTDQEEAAQQFEDVLTRIKTVYGLDGGEIEPYYTGLKADYEACQDRAETVRDRIDQVEIIAADLFAEWEMEIESITNSRLRADSRKSLAETKVRYNKLEKAMHQAEASMQPVLDNLQDYVLYLKHNLNARAIGSLRREVQGIESEVTSLVADMERSIEETEVFLKSM